MRRTVAALSRRASRSALERVPAALQLHHPPAHAAYALSHRNLSLPPANNSRSEPPLSAQHHRKKVLLHSCCAPCSGAMIEEMVSAGHDVTIFFYNPNIHPRAEYEIRKAENKRYAEKLRIPFVDCDYDSDEFHRRARGLEFEPERGRRCSMCFDMRMDVTAAYAKENGFDCFTTTNATSRWKDTKQVNASGLQAAAKHGFRPYYWVYDWQTEAMTQRKYRINAEQRFYKQEYCGCSYSLRDSNAYRKANGIPPVRIGGEAAGMGSRYYEDPEADAADESQEVVNSFFTSDASCFGGNRLYEGRRKQDADAATKTSDSDLAERNNW